MYQKSACLLYSPLIKPNTNGSFLSLINKNFSTQNENQTNPSTSFPGYTQTIISNLGVHATCSVNALSHLFLQTNRSILGGLGLIALVPGLHMHKSIANYPQNDRLKVLGEMVG